jgi:hypothetical protein
MHTSGYATGTRERDEHGDRPGDPDIRGHSEPDNMEVHLVCCKQEQTEPGSPGKQATDTSPTVGVGVDLGQDSEGGEQEKDNQSRNLGLSTQHQQPTRARRSMIAPANENNPERYQPTQIGVVEVAADQSRTVRVQAKQDKKNQNQEQEDRECDARAAPCQEDAEQELHTGKTGGDRPQEQEEGDSPREDRARAHARARQATQVPLNETGGASGEEAEAQIAACPDQAEDRKEDGSTIGRSASQKSSNQEPGERQDTTTRPVSKPTLSAAAAQHRKAQTETGQAETNQGK